jgi:hypothetical protein
VRQRPAQGGHPRNKDDAGGSPAPVPCSVPYRTPEICWDGVGQAVDTTPSLPAVVRFSWFSCLGRSVSFTVPCLSLEGMGEGVGGLEFVGIGDGHAPPETSCRSPLSTSHKVSPSPALANGRRERRANRLSHEVRSCGPRRHLWPRSRFVKRPCLVNHLAMGDGNDDGGLPGRGAKRGDGNAPSSLPQPAAPMPRPRPTTRAPQRSHGAWELDPAAGQPYWNEGDGIMVRSVLTASSRASHRFSFGGKNTERAGGRDFSEK